MGEKSMVEAFYITPTKSPNHPKSTGAYFFNRGVLFQEGRISIRNVILTCFCSPSRVLVYIYIYMAIYRSYNPIYK